jgi:hypothetical protein
VADQLYVSHAKFAGALIVDIATKCDIEVEVWKMGLGLNLTLFLDEAVMTLLGVFECCSMLQL